MDKFSDLEIKINKDPPKWVCRVCKDRIGKKELIILFHSSDKNKKIARQHFHCTFTTMKGNKFMRRLEIALNLAKLPDKEKKELRKLIRSM